MVRNITSIIFLYFFVSCQHSIKSDKHIVNDEPSQKVKDILSESKETFEKTETDHFRYYAVENSFPHRHLKELMEEAETAYQHNLNLLGFKNTDYKIDLFYFDDRKKLKPFTGFTPKGIAFPPDFSLLIATNDSTRAYHVHEMMHIISINGFGGYAAAPGEWLQEGLSVYADNPCLQYQVQEIAAYLMYKKGLVPVDTLAFNFRSLPDMAAYMQAGSIVQYIMETYGQSSFENLWKSGIAHMKEILGVDPLTLQKEYENFLLKKYPQMPDVNWALLDKKGCG